MTATSTPPEQPGSEARDRPVENRGFSRTSRRLAFIIGSGRVAFGVALLAFPRRLGTLVFGPTSDTVGARAAIRGFGGRDIVMGLTVLLANDDATRAACVRMGAIADASDGIATAASFRELGPERWLGLLLPAAVAALSLAAGQRSPRIVRAWRRCPFGYARSSTRSHFGQVCE